MGSITKITDIAGSIVEQYEYDVFGVAYASVNNVEAVTEAQGKKTLNIKKVEGSEADNGNSDELTIDNIRYKRYNGIGKIGNTRLYTGREYDAELKLYYNRARYYSPDLGRFISRDPIDVADDVNLYAYVGNNGVMYSDPSGEAKRMMKYMNLYLSQTLITKGLERYNKINPFDSVNYLNSKNKEIEYLSIIKEIHYNRNQYLNIPDGINIKNYINLGFNEEKKSRSTLHQFGVDDNSNIKLLSDNLHQEIIFDKYGNIVNTPENIGTYNFGTTDKDHVLLDVIPYLWFGNSADDTTTYEQRRNLILISFPEAIIE